MTLEEAIQQMVNLGEKDPLTAARKIVERNEPQWLAEQLLQHAEDIIAEYVRRAMTESRRRSTRALMRASGQTKESVDFTMQTQWVPSRGDWVPIREMEMADVMSVARWYHKASQTLSRYASHWYEIAGEMGAQGAAHVGDLKAIPPLPEIDEVDLPDEIPPPAEEAA